MIEPIALFTLLLTPVATFVVTALVVSAFSRTNRHLSLKLQPQQAK